MKKLSKLLLIIAILGLGFNSCEEEGKEEVVEVAGEIPGMGNATGKLEAEPYDFHEDLMLGTIVGANRETLKSASADEWIMEDIKQGSGDWVVVTLSFTNTSNDWRTASILAGTVFEVDRPGYQNGIALAPVVICVEGGTTRTVKLYLYCLNYGKSESDTDAKYELLGTTTSDVMNDLVNALKGKMVNYEDYLIYYGSGALSAFDDVRDELQEIVWSITNGDGMDQGDYDYINSLPDLPSDALSGCSGCGLETAWGGNDQGDGKAWWFYYDASVGGQQDIYSGKHKAAGTTVEFVNGQIIIDLGSTLRLQDVSESVKIQGYYADDLPSKRPNAGHFSKKGENLTVDYPDGVDGPYDYFAIHLDVIDCGR